MNKLSCMIFFGSAAFLISTARPALAQEDKTAVSTEQSVSNKSAEVPVKPADAQPVEPAQTDKIAETPAKVPESPVKPPETPATPKEEQVKPLSSSAQQLAPLAESYRQAYEAVQRWMRNVSDQSAIADGKIRQIQGKITENEASITRLKLESARENKSRISDLNKQNKELWKELEAAKRDKAEFCSSLSKTAAQKVREFSDDIKAKLKAVQAQLEKRLD